MTAPFDVEIRDQLARYLAGEISLQVFEEWFVSHSWDVQRTGNENAFELVYKIELRLAEFSKGHRTEQELQNLLLPLLEHYSFGITSQIKTFSTSEVSRPQVTFQQSLGDIQLKAASS